MLRQIHPRTARSKRELSKREPLVRENNKTVLFLRGTSCSSLVQETLSDFHSLKRPYCVRFSKKNDIHPFQDASSLEFFSRKNDTSLLLCFRGQLLDMLEFYIGKETARCLSQFRGEKCKVGVKPLLAFSGTQFESPEANQYTLAKSLLTDFFRGGEMQTVDVEGLQLLLSFAVGEADEDKRPAKIHMRSWKIITRRSGQKMPRIELKEMGPRIDFILGRSRMAETSVWREAMKKPKGVEAKPKKNVETDIVGDKIGRIHLGNQDLTGLQTRKMKGLKRSPDTDIRDGIAADDASIVSKAGEGATKRQKIA
ncbi:MAG: hypothetical protein LQ342_004868 [Letrouitia transgressa]|nr:MAG: hypothetical protein LQ342_004868 [Letrouitia transgressa]